MVLLQFRELAELETTGAGTFVDVVSVMFRVRVPPACTADCPFPPCCAVCCCLRCVFLLQFRKLAELETTEAGTIVDVISVLDTVRAPQLALLTASSLPAALLPVLHCRLCCVPLLQFRKLAELETTESGTIVDVIGVLDTVEPWAVINKKDGTETRKRSLTIRDDSGRSVEVREQYLFSGMAGSISRGVTGVVQGSRGCVFTAGTMTTKFFTVWSALCVPVPFSCGLFLPQLVTTR